MSSFQQHLRNFWQRNEGSVSIEWIALSAASCGLALAMTTALLEGDNNTIEVASNNIDSAMQVAVLN